jgi:pimeloyl-ACP methyl ester carboxylesterase
MQGMLTLPQFMAKKSDDGSSFWKSRDEDGISSVGAVIDGAFGNDPLSTPPKDDDGSGNVTYRFPFAQHVEDIKVPVLVTYPDANSGCAKPYKTIIFQHGITTDRTASLGFANSLAAPTAGCFATVAIDLPTHGLDASSTDRNGVAERYAPFNAFNVAGYVLPPSVPGNPATTPTPTAATIAGAGTMFDGLGERHENLALNALQQPVPMNFVAGSESGNSGDMFINLTNFQQTRDHLRQAVMDMLNLNASIAAMDLDGAGSDFAAGDLDANNVHFAGHSLGAVTGLTFVAVNNAIANNPAILDKDINPIKTAVLANPGGQLPKMLENSPSFSAKILPGLAAGAGLTQGMADLEKFFSIFQAPLDSVDPVNFTDLLKDTNTPVLMFEMVGGGLIDATDSAAATTKLPDLLINAGGYPADTVVPNNANPALNGVETGKSYLSGTDPLVSQLGLATVTNSEAPTGNNLLLVSKFKEGTHGTFSSADAPTVFAEMIKQSASFMGSEGQAVVVGDTDQLAQ